MQGNLKSLVGKLNDVSRRSLEAALGFCLSRTNYSVEVEHWLAKLLEADGADLYCIARYFEMDLDALSRDLQRALDRKKTGNADTPPLSPNIVHWIREAWLVASIGYGAGQIRSGHLLIALLTNDVLAPMASTISSQFESIEIGALQNRFRSILEDSTEKSTEMSASAPAVSAPGAGPTGDGGVLDQFTIDLTARARAGDIDPVLGRDAEIRQVIDILTRRRQNNPILTGEAGVGKTAVVEGFALRIAAGDVPPTLANVAVRSLDLALLQAGAGIRGEFENRLKGVIQQVKESPQPVILFIDEAHTMIGAGGQAGQGDAANILKPALARGELRTLAATTWAEYKKYFEADAALARRFQVVKVEEPEEALAVEMMRGILPVLEQHHGVRILDEAVVDAVRLSSRYISGRQLPDKSVSLLDTASARVAIGQTAVPPQIEDLRRRLVQLERTSTSLKREAATGTDHTARLSELEQDTQHSQESLAALEERWETEKRLVREILNLRQQLEGLVETPETEPDAAPLAEAAAAQQVAEEALAETGGTDGSQTPPTDPEALRSNLQARTADLKTLQGESPLLQYCVDSQTIADVVSDWTGIPVRRMVSDEIQSVLSLKEKMEESIIGQSHALDAIVQRVHISRARLGDPRQPIGVFLLAGTSGVGKTEAAITLANLLYGGEQNMTVINMSEFKEEHKVSLLMGSPPGYVGYGEGGILTEAVRRKPYSVVLLDEMEKAHPGVQDIFYQVFDKGTLRDGTGRDIDFRNTLIIMTTNAGSDLVKSLCIDPDTRPNPEKLREAMHEELLKTFKPAFLGRLNVVPFYPLTDDVMARIVELKLGKIARRVHENYRAQFHYSPDVVEHVVARCTEVDTGARNVDHILSGTMMPDLAREFLARLSENADVTRVQVGVAPEGQFSYEIS